MKLLTLVLAAFSPLVLMELWPGQQPVSMLSLDLTALLLLVLLSRINFVTFHLATNILPCEVVYYIPVSNALCGQKYRVTSLNYSV